MEYLIIWWHNGPARACTRRPNAGLLVWRHLGQAGVLAVLQSCSSASPAGRGSPCCPIGLGTALLWWRSLGRGCRLLWGGRGLLMRILLLCLILIEETGGGERFEIYC